MGSKQISCFAGCKEKLCFNRYAHRRRFSRIKDAKTKGKAASIRREITTVRFVKILHFMLDLMDIITETSKIFQREKLTIPEVPDIIQETTMKLMNLKQHVGNYSK